MKNWILIPLLGILLCSCGKSNKGLASLLCSLGQDRSAMTLGLNLDFLEQFSLQNSGNGVSNDDLKNKLNDILGLAAINPSHLRVETVSSAGNDPYDDVRFLRLGGNFLPGFGVATQLFKQAAASYALQSGSSPFRFINESFDVAATLPARSLAFDGRPWLHDISRRSMNPFLSYATLQDSLQRHPRQWAFAQTDWEKALEHLALLKSQSDDPATEDSPIIVAIFDTGVDSEHPDLKDIMVDGFDALDTSTGTLDENGHGTHCAGIVASQITNPGTSALGVATAVPVRIMPIKVLGKDGGGSFQAIEKGLQWAIRYADPKPDVLSMSLGAGLEYQDMSAEMQELKNELIQEAIDQGMIVIVAAGNESCPLGGTCRHRGGIFPKSFQEYTVLPCAYEGVICVGASDANEKLATYSNFSSGKADANYRVQADVNAPGTNIYSTWPTQLDTSYRTISGTSMATPYVAGVAALMKSVRRDLTQEDFRRIIASSQVKPDEMLEKSGVGRLDLYQALVNFGVDEDIGLGAPIPEDFVEPDVNEVEDPTPANDSRLPLDLWSAICG